MLKKIFRLFNKPVAQEVKQSNEVAASPVAERRTFTESGDFIKANEFESMWVAYNVNRKFLDPDPTDFLDDDDYIDYHLWEDMNSNELYKKHLPQTKVFRGSNPNIIFHGGCLGCLSQRLNGFERCKGCLYFRFSRSGKQDLHIKGEESATITAAELKKLLDGNK